jgi:DNA-directed RNA polymerase alpha subunit
VPTEQGSDAGAMSDELDTMLSRSLDELRLPTRVANWAAREGIATLGEIVRRHPSDLMKERNLGRRSIAQLRASIVRVCGREWEELWREVQGPLAKITSVDDVEWDALGSLLPEDVLSLPLAQLELPKRMEGYCAREGLQSVRDLVSVTRATLGQAPNLGRLTIAATEQILLRRTTGAPALEESGWDALSSVLPEALLQTAALELDLPTRMRAYVEREGVKTVGQLLRFPQSALQQAPNLGRRSIRDTRELLLKLAKAPPTAWSAHASFWGLWRDRLSGLEPLERLVLTQRSGIHGDARTLLEIGEMLGVTRERVRQIETRAITRARLGGWVGYVCERLTGELDGGARWVDELDPAGWFAPIDEARLPAFEYFLERFAESAITLGAIEGRYAVVLCTRDELAARWSRAVTTLMKLPVPAHREEIERAIGAVARSPGLARIFHDALEDRIHLDAERRMIAFGATRGAEVLAFLRQQPGPVSIHDVYAALGRVRFPEEVFYFERGLVGLAAHFPDYEAWKARLVPICVRIMEQDPRQWRALDLFEAIGEDALLPDWLTHRHLAEILRRSPEVRYLGRMRVALAGANEEERLKFADVAHEILAAHGEPLELEELRRRITSQTTIGELSFRSMVLHTPFVAVDDERVGLMSRDVPGGTDAIGAFADALALELERSQRGLSGGALAGFVTRSSDVHARWTLPMARSVARSDARFQLSRGGAVGLSEWDDVRVPTRREVVRAIVEEHGGRAPISTVLARIHAFHGARLERRQLGALAFQAGVRLQGDMLVAGEAQRDRGAPERRAIFESLLARPLEDEAELVRALDAHVAMFRRERAAGAPVDDDEAAALADRCRALLSRARERDDGSRALAQAAVRYFLLRDDAETDLSAGGLDDDAAMIREVEAKLA